MNNRGSFKSFSDIIGQERAIGFLKQALSRDRIPHAYMFTGISGIGKTTTALALAQALNCLEPVDFEGCGMCRSCRQIMGGNFADLNLLVPDGKNIKIEQIRELNRNLGYKSVSGQYRVSIIDRAETMTGEAANSFLKNLEEPPPFNILILKVVEPLDLLSTIVSRCQRIPFKPLAADQISDWLKREMKIDDDTVALVSRISDGSLGKAISICKDNYLEERQEMLESLVELYRITAEKTLEMALEYTDKMKKSRPALSESHSGLFELFAIWKTWYRDLILLKSDGPVDKLVNVDFSRKLKNLSKQFKINDLVNSFQVLDKAQRELKRNPNPGLLVENTMLKLKRLSGT